MLSFALLHQLLATAVTAPLYSKVCTATAFPLLTLVSQFLNFKVPLAAPGHLRMNHFTVLE